MQRIFYLMMLVTMAVMPLVAHGATESELKERFKQRYPQLQQYKMEGKIGETSQGFVEVVKPQFAADSAVQGTVSSENADRRELYELLGKQTSTSAETVAQRNAARNFQKARTGEWLRHADGVWRQK